MRVYGKKTKLSEGYYEIEYKEYREDGTLKAIGTEDFSTERYRTLEHRFVYIWDGEKYNKGGHRWFDFVGSVDITEGCLKELKQYIKAKYPQAVVIQARLS